MASRPVGAATANIIEMRINIPREISALKSDKILFTSDDFNLNWIDFLKKHKRRQIYEFLGKHKGKYVMQDIRRDNDRSIWLMTHTIKDFINSFKKTMQTYRAHITKRTDKMVISKSSTPNANAKPQQTGPSKPVKPAPVLPQRTKPPPAVASTSSAATNNNNIQGSTSGGRSEPASLFKRPAPPTNDGSKAKYVRVAAGEVNMRNNSSTSSPPRRNQAPPPPSFSYMNYDLDDVISMANSVDSQDSQLEDLVRQGVKITEIKPQVVQNVVKHVDNLAMLRIRKELQEIIDSGRWLKLTARLPITAGALQLIFGLRLTPSNGR